MIKFKVGDKVRPNGNKKDGDGYIYINEVDEFLKSKPNHCITRVLDDYVILQGSDYAIDNSWIEPVNTTGKVYAKISVDTSKIDECMNIYIESIKQVQIAFSALQQAIEKVTNKDNIKIEVINE